MFIETYYNSRTLYYKVQYSTFCFLMYLKDWMQMNKWNPPATNRNNLDISAQKLFFKRPSPSNDRKISNPPIKVKSPTITARCIKSDFFLVNRRDKKPRINKTRPRQEGINDVNDLLSLVTHKQSKSNHYHSDW